MRRSQVRGDTVRPSNRPESRSMDRHNNWHVAPVIGRVADSPEDVVAGAPRAIERAAAHAGSGLGNTATWLRSSEWVEDGPNENWPAPDWPRLADADHLHAYRRQAALPPAGRLPNDAPTPPDDAGGGPVFVRPHSREGHPVRGYSRSAP